MKSIVFDLEANGYLQEATKIHCICWKYLDESEVYEEVGDYDGFLDNLIDNNLIIGHNIIGYDLPLLRKLLKEVQVKDICDTLVWSNLFFPNLQSPEGWKGKPKPHSLEAWAMRLGGIQKQEHEDWENFSAEMLERCKKDVLITEKLYKKLLRYYNEEY